MILTSGPSSTAFRMICYSKRSLTTPTSVGSCSTSQRWLTAPMQMPDGTLVAREKGTPQGSPISPLLANLFMHYAFDTWMAREFPGCPFERYADDIVAHCDTEDQAQRLLGSIATRLGSLGLSCTPRRRRSCYCKDATAARNSGAHQLRFPRLYLPGPPGQWDGEASS